MGYAWSLPLPLVGDSGAHCLTIGMGWPGLGLAKRDVPD